MHPLGEGGAGFGMVGVEGAVLKTGNSSSDDAGEATKSSCSGVRFNFSNTSLSRSSVSESESLIEMQRDDEIRVLYDVFIKWPTNSTTHSRFYSPISGDFSLTVSA